MMKYLTLFLLLLFNTQSDQKVLTGDYCTCWSYVGFCATFHADNSFVYSGWTCTSMGHGQGRYRFTDDSLTLFFTSADTVKNEFKINSRTLSDTSVIGLNVHILRKTDHQVIAKAAISFWHLAGLMKEIARSDSSGNALVRFPKRISPVTIQVEAEGYKTWVGDIIPDMNMDCSVLLATDSIPDEIDDGTVTAYHIVLLEKDSLILRDANYEFNLSRRR